MRPNVAKFNKSNRKNGLSSNTDFMFFPAKFYCPFRRILLGFFRDRHSSIEAIRNEGLPRRINVNSGV